MDLVHILEIMGTFIKENGKMIRFVEKANLNGLMAKGFHSKLMVIYMMDNGKTTKEMDME